MSRKCNINTGEISLCPGCGCMTHDILGSDGIYCGKCKTQKTSTAQNDTTSSKTTNLHVKSIAHINRSKK